MTLWLLPLARSGRFVFPLAAELLLLLLVYAYDDNPVLDSYGTTALYLVGLGAWIGLLALDGVEPPLRELAIAHRGRLTADLHRLAAGLVLVVGLAALAVLAPVVVGAFDHAPTASELLDGLLAHVACGAIGLGLAACVARPVVGRIAVAGAVIVGALLVIVAVGAPPLSLLDALHDGTDVTGPLIGAGAVAVGLLTGSLVLSGCSG